MRRRGLLGLAAVCALLAGCGDDDDSSSDAGTPEQARQAVIGTIAAYANGPDWAAVCELADARTHEALQGGTKQDSCEAAYEQIEANQQDFLAGSEHPIDDFARLLQEYDVGEATLTDDGAEVKLSGPSGPATSYLVLEDGSFKVSELFVTPDAAAPGSFKLPNEGN